MQREQRGIERSVFYRLNVEEAVPVNGGETLYFESVREADRHGFNRSSVRHVMDTNKLYKDYCWIKANQ